MQAMSPHQSHTDQRLTALEIQLSYTEDLLDTLNQLVIKQQDQIDLLLREVGKLRRQGSDDALPHLRSPQDELPPHY